MDDNLPKPIAGISSADSQSRFSVKGGEVWRERPVINPPAGGPLPPAGGKNLSGRTGKKRKIWAAAGVLAILLAALAGGVFLVERQQEIRKQAKTTGWNNCNGGKGPNEGESCRKHPERTFEGDCQIVYCPNGCSGTCSLSDPGAWREVVRCNNASLGNSCGQIDTVDSSSKRYCMPDTTGCDTKEINCDSNCIGEPEPKTEPSPIPTLTPAPTPTPTTVGCSGNNYFDTPPAGSEFTVGKNYQLGGWAWFCQGPNGSGPGEVDLHFCDENGLNCSGIAGNIARASRPDTANTCSPGSPPDPNTAGWNYDFLAPDSPGRHRLLAAAINDRPQNSCVIWSEKEITIVSPSLVPSPTPTGALTPSPTPVRTPTPTVSPGPTPTLPAGVIAQCVGVTAQKQNQAGVWVEIDPETEAQGGDRVRFVSSGSSNQGVFTKGAFFVNGVLYLDEVIKIDQAHFGLEYVLAPGELKVEAVLYHSSEGWTD